MSLTGLILAAGKGKRMQSGLPKVLHPVAGIPMLERVIQALENIPCDDLCLILSQNIADFSPLLDRYPSLAVCIQYEANGTGGAVASAQDFFEGVSAIPYGKGSLLKGLKTESQELLICAGDTPALDVSILREFIEVCRSQSAKLGVLGIQVPNPTGYGRLILSEKGKLLSIIEEKDADEKTRKITLCNSGVIFADTRYLFELLTRIENKNVQNEYYLTDCIRIAADDGDDLAVFVTDKWQSFQGVNDKEQLASLEAWFRDNKLRG